MLYILYTEYWVRSMQGSYVPTYVVWSMNILLTCSLLMTWDHSGILQCRSQGWVIVSDAHAQRQRAMWSNVIAAGGRTLQPHLYWGSPENKVIEGFLREGYSFWDLWNPVNSLRPFLRPLPLYLQISKTIPVKDPNPTVTEKKKRGDKKNTHTYTQWWVSQRKKLIIARLGITPANYFQKIPKKKKGEGGGKEKKGTITVPAVVRLTNYHQKPCETLTSLICGWL